MTDYQQIENLMATDDNSCQVILPMETVVSSEALSDTRRIGISIAALRQFCEMSNVQSRRGMTTRQVRDIVMEITKARKCSLVDWFALEHDGLAKKLIGTANIYVSHARQSNFDDLLQVITDFWQDEGCPADMYFWYDCLTVNQHNLETIQSSEAMTQQLGESLHRIGRALIVFSPCHEPIYLTRRWCLFELYMILQSDVQRRIMMPVKDSQQFVDFLINDSLRDDGGLFGKLLNIRISQATARYDNEVLNRAINILMAIENLNKRISAALTDWLANIGITYLQDMAETNANYLLLMQTVARWRLSQCKYADAEQTFRKCLQFKGQEHENPHLVIGTIEKLAVSLEKQTKYAEAEQAHRECLEMSEKILGASHPDTLRTLSNYAECLHSRGEYAEAERMHRKCLQLRQATLGDDHPDTISSVEKIALCLDNQGRLDEAEHMYRKGWELWEQLYCDFHPDTLTSMNNLANCLLKQGKYSQAEGMHHKCLKLTEIILNERRLEYFGCCFEDKDLHDEWHIFVSLYCQTQRFEKEGKYVEALEKSLECIKILMENLGDKDPYNLSFIKLIADFLFRCHMLTEAVQMYRIFLNASEKLDAINYDLQSKNGKSATLCTNSRQLVQKSTEEIVFTVIPLGRCLLMQGKIVEEEQFYRKCLEWKCHRYTKYLTGKLADCLNKQGKYLEAEEMYKKFLELNGNFQPTNEATNFSSLATCLEKQGKYAEAEQMYRKALELKQKIQGENYLDTLFSLTSLALCLDRQGKYAEVESMFQLSLQLEETALNKAREKVQNIVSDYRHSAIRFANQGMPDRAEEMQQKILKFKAQHKESTAPGPIPYVNSVALALYQNGKFAQAEVMFGKSLQLRKTFLGDAHEGILLSLNHQASCLANLARYGEAEQAFRRCYDLRQKKMGLEHPETIASLNNVALCLYHENKYEEAEAMLRRCFVMRSKIFGNDHPYTKFSRSFLNQCLVKQGKVVDTTM